jgi:adenosylhomocysteine nucleosidase
MAFGISSSAQKLGEVLVSRRVFPYDMREVHDAETGYLSDYRKTTSLKAHGGLVRMFERASKRIQYPFRVSFGTLLSGGARISSRRFRDEIASTVVANPVHGTPIGGDMEAVGLLSVAHKWVVVKAISDFAEDSVSTTDDAARTGACQNAVRFALTALQNDAFDDPGRE